MERRRSAIVLAMVLVFVVDFTSGSIYLNPAQTDVYLNVNGTYAVTCKDTGGRAVRWSGPQGDIGLKGRPHVQTTSFGSSLMFENITSHHRGRYVCTAGQDSVHFDLSITKPIHFMDTPSVQVGVENKNVVLKCEVSGDPKPEINWYVGGARPMPPKYQMLGDGLEIKNVTRDDPRNFTCTAFQVLIGLFKEKKIQLHVYHKPVSRLPVHAKVVQAWGFIHGEVNLTCEAEAEPAATFLWYRNQNVLRDSGKIHHEKQRSILQLFIKDDKIFGDYKCKATNKLGTLEQIISLNKGVKPTPPDVLEVKGANADHLMLVIRGPEISRNATPKEMLPIGYRIQYRPFEENVEWKLAAHEDFDKIDGADEYMLGNLQHNTMYEIRVATRNPAGLSDYRHVTTARTLIQQNDGVALGPSSASLICLNALLFIVLFT